MAKEKIHTYRIRETRGDRVFDIVNVILLALILFISAYPLYYTIVASVSNSTALYTGKVYLWPKGFQLEAYRQVFKNKQIWTGYRNSIVYTVCGTLFNLFLTIPAAYALSKKKLFGRNLIMTYFLIPMYFGGGMIPSYLLNKSLGLVNSPLVLIITGGISIYNVIVTRTYFASNVPDSIYEAANIDGCGELRTFMKIALPLSDPIVAVMALYYGVGHWNGYFTALIYVTKPALQPLALVLRKILVLNEMTLDVILQGDGNISGETIAAAAEKSKMIAVMKYALVFIASAPMLIAYPFIQKYFVKGVMIGSVKG